MNWLHSAGPKGFELPTRKNLIIGGLIGLVQFLLLLPAATAYLSLQDEGNLLAWASRMKEGQVPYQDFFLRFMPGTAAVLRLGFAVFGEMVWVPRLYFLLSVSILAVVIWAVSEALLPRPWSFFPVFCFMAVGGQAWPMLAPHWDATITALLALYVLVKAEKDWHFLLAGSLAGFTVLFLQPRGVAICLVLGILALLEVPRLRRLLLTVVGAMIPGALFVTWLLTFGIFGAFWEQAVMYNLTNYSKLQHYPFDFRLTLSHFGVLSSGLQSSGTVPWGAWLSWFFSALSFTVVELVKYTLFLPVVAVALALCKGPSPRQRLLFGLVLLCAFSAYLGWSRANQYHFNFFTPFWYPVFFYCLWHASQRVRPLKPLVGLILICFFWHGFDNVSSWRTFRFPVVFSRGMLYSDNQDFARSTQVLTNLLRRDFKNKPVFGFPEVPMIIWLSGAQNPTSFESLVPILNPDQQFLEARRQLEKAAPCGIIYRPSGKGIAGNYPALSPMVYERTEKDHVSVLTRGARLVVEEGGFLLFELPALSAPKSTEP